MGEIFGEAPLANVLELYRQTSSLAPEEKFPLLRDAVFPPGRDTLRIEIDFSPSHVTAHTVKAYGIGDPSRISGRSAGDGSPSLGGQLLAPAIELMRMAKELGRIDEVEELLKRRSAHYDDAAKELAALRVLIAIARDEFDTAQDLILQFHDLVSRLPVLDAERAAETVVLWSAAACPELRQAAAELSFLVYEQVRNGHGPSSERWQRQMFALRYLLQWITHDERAITNNEPGSLEHWHPVTRATAETSGRGFPLPIWHRRPGVAAHVTGHDRDYLYYDAPLTGNFCIEADVSAFNYRDTRLAFGGIWAGPGWDHTSILNGHFGGDDPTIMIDPPLDELETPIRVRLTVKNGIRTTFINGRNIFEAKVSQSDPWLAILNQWNMHGWVENVRITGDVAIPDEIELATDASLTGWHSYYGESVGTADGSWRLVEANRLNFADPGQDLVLQGKRDPQYAGAFQESLLRYHRPVFEDGTISYEFYYRQGEMEVHPSLDRYAFLLDPAGVSTHWIGDGRYERTGLDPANKTLEAGNQRGEEPLPLRESAWNSLDLAVSGDTLGIRLNEQLVFQRELEPTNQRTFGLFHYADQTEARVRDIRWRGDWPKSLPAAIDQELADDSVEEVLADLSLPFSFEHDFAEGIPLDKFLISGEGWKDHFEQLPDGVRLVRVGQDGYVRHAIIPHVQLQGDFDVVAEFERFDASIAEGGDGNIQLFVGFEEGLTECRMYRKFSRYEKKELGEQIIQAAHFYVVGEERRYEFPEKTSDATSAGKLRLVRRDDQVYYLYAPGGSSNYRHLHTQSVPTGPTRRGDLRLVLETTKPGRAEVVWKSLSVRSEGISGLATLSTLSVADLNRSRAALKAVREFDLSDSSTSQHFRRWGTNARFQWGDKGIRIAAPGFDTWQGHGMAANVSLSGDFDVALEIDVEKIDEPAAGGESVAYLEAELGDAGKTAIQTKFAMSPRGTTAAEIQLRQPKPGGNFDYQELASIPFEEAHVLRIARRGGIAYFVFQETPSSEPTLLGRIEVGNAPIPLGHLRSIVHTSGEGHETIVLFKKLSVHADAIESSNPG